MQKDQERYKKGFNHGYTLAQEGIKLPKLDSKNKSTSKNEYVDGLKEGTKEFSKEKSIKKGISKLSQKEKGKSISAPSKSKGRSK